MSATGQQFVLDNKAANTEAFAANPCSGKASTSGKEQFITTRTLLSKAAPLCEATADFFTVILAILMAASLDFPLHSAGSMRTLIREIAVIAITAAAFVVLLYNADHAYRRSASMLRIRETERAIRIPVQVLLTMLPFILSLHSRFSDISIFRVFLFVPLFLILQKQMLTASGRLFRKGNSYGLRVAIYGSGSICRRIASALFASPLLALHPVVVIDDGKEPFTEWSFELGYRRHCPVPVRRGPVAALHLQSCKCELLLLAIPNLSPEELAEAARAAKRAGVQIACIADPGAYAGPPGIETIEFDGLFMTSIADLDTPWHYALAKRAFDVALSFLLLVLLAPLLMAIALLIRMDSAGPAFFIQKRVGLNGRLFDIYKFRTMHVDAPKYDISPTTPNDRRITRIGRFLRRTSLDELPQLLNVFLGDMSLVGPRPEMPFVVRRYNTRHRQRLQVVPGITGLWQLSADRIFRIHENIEYDLYYIRNRSFFMDMAILLHTLFFAMRGV